MPSTALIAVARLRRIAAALEAGGAPDADDAGWLADRLARYFAEAPRGLTVDMALGRAPMPGAAAWWTDLAIETRDHALRSLAARFHPERRVASQAYQIERRALRYAAASWRHDRDRETMAERELTGAVSAGDRVIVKEAWVGFLRGMIAKAGGAPVVVHHGGEA